MASQYTMSSSGSGGTLGKKTCTFLFFSYSGVLAAGRRETNDKYPSEGGLDVLECHMFACPQQKHKVFQRKTNLLHLQVRNSQ
jgi:hypothetical protein